MRFDQKSPVNPVFEFRGDPLSVTDGRTKDGQTKILVFNIWWVRISCYNDNVKKWEYTYFSEFSLVLFKIP